MHRQIISPHTTSMLYGLVGGAVVGAMWGMLRRRKIILKLVEQNTLKTELINWMLYSVVELEPDQFIKEFSTRAGFINITLRG